jgi:hypothetical protein
MAMRPPTRIGITNTPPPNTVEPASAPPRDDYEIPAGATAAVYAARRYGGPTRIREVRVAIGVAVTPILGNNPKRLFWLLSNVSVNAMAYGQDFSLTLTNGLPLAPSGGGVSMSVDEDAEAVCYPVNAIAAVAASATYAVEVERI